MSQKICLIVYNQVQQSLSGDSEKPSNDSYQPFVVEYGYKINGSSDATVGELYAWKNLQLNLMNQLHQSGVPHFCSSYSICTLELHLQTFYEGYQ